MSWLGSCCTPREGDDFPDGVISLQAQRSVQGDSEAEEAFFDCCETETDLRTLRSQGLRRETDDLRPGAHEARRAAADCCSELAAATAVLTHTKEQWQLIQGNLNPELDWVTIMNARRMLKANMGKVPKAVDMFLQALEFRARDRKLFETLSCEANCDIRVIGRDRKDHPVVYMCANSQNSGLRGIRDQFVVTFETACKMTSEDGKVVFIVDMFGVKPHLCMDFVAMKEMTDILGCVFAERIHKIVTIDLATAAWWMLKPCLCEATQKKFSFIPVSKAVETLREEFASGTWNTIQSTFDINRSSSTVEERADHARRTTYSEPAGSPNPEVQ